MERKNRIYPEEFKLEALEMLKTSGKSAGQIERELGITPGLLTKWRARFQIIQNGSEPAHLGPKDLDAAKCRDTTPEARIGCIRRGARNPKKAVGLLHSGARERYKMIDTLKKTYRMSLLCKVLEVSRSGYYAWLIVKNH